MNIFFYESFSIRGVDDTIVILCGHKNDIQPELTSRIAGQVTVLHSPNAFSLSSYMEYSASPDECIINALCAPRTCRYISSDHPLSASSFIEPPFESLPHTIFMCLITAHNTSTHILLQNRIVYLQYQSGLR